MRLPSYKAAAPLAAEATEDLGFLRLSGAYREAPSISLDYAIAEKADNLRCVPLNTPWSDVGSWSALWSLLEKDDAGNVALGEGEILLEETSGSLAYSNHACVAVVGLKDVVVSATEDAVLVISKEYAESVKSIVEHLKRNGGAHTLDHVAGVPALGLVSGAQPRRPLSSEMHHGEAGRNIVAAKPLSSLRALGRGQRARWR